MIVKNRKLTNNNEQIPGKYINLYRICKLIFLQFIIKTVNDPIFSPLKNRHHNINNPRLYKDKIYGVNPYVVLECYIRFVH